MITRSILPLLLLFIASCTNNPGKESKSISESAVYKPDSQELYNDIIKQDSIYFTAYNNCDMEKQAAMYSDSIEFYHDRGGLTRSKQIILDGIKNNICGKVTRELVKGTIEVYPIHDFGAIEMGQHMFHNNQEKNDTPHPSKFIIIWQHVDDQWFISRVVSLH
jgi:hypothetical protein